MAPLGPKYVFITPAHIGQSVEAMTKEIPCDTDDDLETVMDTLDTLGVSYEVTHVVEVASSDDANVLAVDNSPTSEPGETAADGGMTASAGVKLPPEDTKRYAVLKEVALHDKKWVKVDDLIPGAGRKQISKVRSHLDKLAEAGALRKKTLDERHPSNGHRRVGFAASEPVRREMAQYDSLNGGSE